jgi:hypothetical protein
MAIRQHRNSSRTGYCPYVCSSEESRDCHPDGHRWGLHNLRHSLSNWLVNKAKENPKNVQGILWHSRIQTTLDLYTDEDPDEKIAAQDKFLDAVGSERETVLRRVWVELWVSRSGSTIH